MGNCPLFLGVSLKKRILHVDHDTNTVHFSQDDGDGGIIITTRQDVTEIVEDNKAHYAMTDSRARWGEMTRVANIPNAVIQDLNKKGILRGFHILDTKRFKAWLNDSDNQHFRVRPGRV